MVAEAGLEPTPCCGARRMSLATERLRPSPTAATRSLPLVPPLAAVSSLPSGNPEVGQGLLHKPKKEKSHPRWDDFFFSGCGGRTRTYDLRVMSYGLHNFIRE